MLDFGATPFCPSKSDGKNAIAIVESSDYDEDRKWGPVLRGVEEVLNDE